MRWHLDRKSAVGLGLALIILIGAGYMAYWRLQRLLETSRQVVHTREALDALEETLQVMEQAESSQRGYLLTGKDSYLESYRAEIVRIPEVLARFRGLTADNPVQQQEIASLARLIESRKEGLAKNIETRNKKGMAVASKAVLSGVGKQRMDAVRAAIGQMENKERGDWRRRPSTGKPRAER